MITAQDFTYSHGSAVADFINRNGFGEENLPMFYRDEGGMMIVNEALGNEGQGGGSTIGSLIDAVGISMDGSISSYEQAIFATNLLQELVNAGWKDPQKTIPKFEDLYCLIDKLPSLQELYCTIQGVRFYNNQSMVTPGKAAFYDIDLNIRLTKNILSYAFTIGHEMTHSFTDIHFRNRFFEIIPQNGRYMRDNTYTYFNEVVGISWELKYGQTRYGDLSGTQAVRKYYLHIDPKAMDIVDPYIKQLMSEWQKMYNSKIKD